MNSSGSVGNRVVQFLGVFGVVAPDADQLAQGKWIGVPSIY